MALTQVRTGGLTDDAVTTDKLYTPNLGRRNLIINGAMQVAQRGTGAATADNEFPVDRWKLSNTASDSADVSAQQSTDTPTGEGFRNSIKWSVGTGSNAVGSQAIRTSLEVQDSTDVLAWGSSGGKTATLSFWIKASQSGTITTSLRESGASACFLDLTTVTTTWVKKSINIPAPTFGSWSTTANAGGVVAIFCFDRHTSASGSTADAWVAANHISLTTQTEWVSIDGAEIYITGVQLEANSQSTPFEHRSYAEELSLCQRYYQQYDYTGTYQHLLDTQAVNANTVKGILPLLTKTRTNPTVSNNGVGNFRINAYAGGLDEVCNTITVNHSEQTYFSVSFAKATSNLTTNMNTYINTEVGNDASFYVDAEL